MQASPWGPVAPVPTQTNPARPPNVLAARPPKTRWRAADVATRRARWSRRLPSMWLLLAGPRSMRLAHRVGADPARLLHGEDDGHAERGVLRAALHVGEEAGHAVGSRLQVDRRPHRLPGRE